MARRSLPPKPTMRVTNTPNDAAAQDRPESRGSATDGVAKIARYLAEKHGFPIIRVVRGEKKARDKGWPEKATNDPGKVSRLIGDGENYGVKTGDGLLVLDLDVKNEANGLATFEKLTVERGIEIDTLTVATPSGGRHYYFRHDRRYRFKSKAGIAPGIDIRGEGGYVVGPGSIGRPSKDAKSFEAYEVVNDRAPAELPQELLDFLIEAGAIKQCTGDAEKPGGAAGPAMAPESTAVDAEHIAKVEETLARLAESRADNYDDWIRIGMALRGELGDAGLPVWIEFSKRSAKFEEGVCEAKWKSFKADRGDAVTVGTLIHMANEDSGPIVPGPTFATGDWGSLRRFEDEALPSVPASISNDPVAKIAKEIAQVAQVDSWMVLASCYALLSSILARSTEVRMNSAVRHPVNLYVVIVAASAERKSTIHRYVMSPLKGILKNAPKEDMILVSDSTPEALIKVFEQTNGTAFVSTGEAAAFLTNLQGRYGVGERFDIALDAYNGEELIHDRVGSGRLRIERAVMGMLLFLQPTALHDLVSDEKSNDRGFLGRMLFVLPPSMVGRRTFEDRELAQAVRDSWGQIVSYCWQLSKREEIKTLRLSSGASERLRSFQEYIERRIDSTGVLHDILFWATRAPEMASRLAAVIECSKRPQVLEHVSKDSMRSALAIIHALTPHYEKALGIGGFRDSQVSKALGIVRAAKKRGWERFNETALFNVIRKQTRLGVRGMDDLRPVLRLLQEHNYIRLVPPPPKDGAGRPRSPEYELHPDLLDA